MPPQRYREQKPAPIVRHSAFHAKLKIEKSADKLRGIGGQRERDKRGRKGVTERGAERERERERERAIKRRKRKKKVQSDRKPIQ